MVAEGAQIRYLGRENGMDGWVTMKQGQPQYFYVTPDQQAILMGIMFNNKGDVITLRQVNELRGKEGPALDTLAGFPSPVKPDTASRTETATPEFSAKALVEGATAPSKSDQLYEAVGTANWIEIGKKDAPVLYSFIDPECPHCHDLLKDIRSSGYIEQGLLKLRIIPVGLISENSLKEAAFLLASSDPQTLLYKHLDGVPNVLLADPSINTQGIQRNMSLMQDWKLDVTPFSVYKDASGKVKILRGRPNDLKKVVTELR
jgi:thiol:disulfide interchange protein DsbG